MYGTIFTTHLHMFARRCTNVLAALLVCRIEDGVHWHLVNVSSTSYIAAAIYDHVSPPTIFHTVTVTWSDPHHACAAQLLSAFWSSGVQYIPGPSWQYIIPWVPSITRCEVLGPCMTTASLIKDSNVFTRADKLPHVWVDLEIFGDWGMVMWLKYCQFQTSSSSSSSTPQSLSSTPPPPSCLLTIVLLILGQIQNIIHSPRCVYTMVLYFFCQQIFAGPTMFWLYPWIHNTGTMSHIIIFPPGSRPYLSLVMLLILAFVFSSGNCDIVSGSRKRHR